MSRLLELFLLLEQFSPVLVLGKLLSLALNRLHLEQLALELFFCALEVDCGLHSCLDILLFVTFKLLFELIDIRLWVTYQLPECLWLCRTVPVWVLVRLSLGLLQTCLDSGLDIP